MISFTRREISAELAYRMVGNAVKLASQKNIDICAVVSDPRGHLVALARTDGVASPAIQYAIDKSWTAASFATSTQSFYESAVARPPVALGLGNRERVLVFPGGFPVFEDECCIAGLGVSGASDGDDIEIAHDVILQSGLRYELSGD